MKQSHCRWYTQSFGSQKIPASPPVLSCLQKQKDDLAKLTDPLQKSLRKLQKTCRENYPQPLSTQCDSKSCNSRHTRKLNKCHRTNTPLQPHIETQTKLVCFVLPMTVFSFAGGARLAVCGHGGRSSVSLDFYRGFRRGHVWNHHSVSNVVRPQRTSWASNLPRALRITAKPGVLGFPLFESAGHIVTSEMGNNSSPWDASLWCRRLLTHRSISQAEEPAMAAERTRRLCERNGSPGHKHVIDH